MSIQNVVENILNQELEPQYIEVINESYMHNVPAGSESHFKVIIVCDVFESKRLLARHRIINNLLKVELENDIHALALHTYTPSEWQRLSDGAPNSPACRGGGAAS